MSSKEEALRRLDNLEKNLVEKYQKTQEEVKRILAEMDKGDEELEALNAKIQRLENAFKEYEGFDRFLMSRIENVVDQRVKALPNIPTQGSPGPEVLQVSKRAPRIEVSQERPKVKVDDKTPEGRLAVLIDDGWWEERHNVKQVVEEFNNRGWSNERKEIEAAMVKFCEMYLLYRKISTGNIMWYELTEDAKERVGKKVKESA